MAPHHITNRLYLKSLQACYNPHNKPVYHLGVRYRIRSPLTQSSQSHRAITTSSSLSSALFNLGGLSTSRESQYLAKEQGRPRTEYSPHLELIRSSEVDTQQSAGSSRVANLNAKELRAARGNVVISSTDGLVTLPQAMYLDLKNEVRGLEKRLGVEELRVKQLEALCQKRSREGMTLGVVCLLLVLGMVYRDELRCFYESHLAAWGSVPEKDDLGYAGPLLLDESKTHSLPRVSENNRDADGVSGLIEDTTAPRPVVEHTRPWKFSRLFWAGDE
ncbi:MAG: hypothetical protein Q9170_004038 [Blastenia crenularia]